MYNYNIKAKHMNDMTCFLTSKNFELITRKQSPPPHQPKAGEPRSVVGVPKTPAKVEKKGLGTGIDGFNPNNSMMSEDSEAARTLVCSENIEKDQFELTR